MTEPYQSPVKPRRRSRWSVGLTGALVGAGFGQIGGRFVVLKLLQRYGVSDSDIARLIWWLAGGAAVGAAVGGAVGWGITVYLSRIRWTPMRAALAGAIACSVLPFAVHVQPGVKIRPQTIVASVAMIFVGGIVGVWVARKAAERTGGTNSGKK